MPDFAAERALAGRQGGPIAGVDEAGRGPHAGPAEIYQRDFAGDAGRLPARSSQPPCVFRSWRCRRRCVP